ncbi:MAG: class I SAM-dependent methyltransferase [Candidatus Lokiarchaeota archaeon]|nr:class I SAM-dependent methyltransferase [Candidatus Lokiarchaeota archaeon]
MSKDTWDTVWEKQQIRQSALHSLIYFLREHYFSSTFARFARKRIKGLILEVGCGTAQCSLKIIAKGTDIIGADFSSSALQVAKKYSASNKLIKFVVTDAFNLPFNENTFNAVWSVGLLEHFETPSLALTEMRRVVKPEGKVIAIVPYKYGPLGMLNYGFQKLGKEWIWEEETPMDQDEMYRIFEQAELRNINVQKMYDTFLMFLGATGEK